MRTSRLPSYERTVPKICTTRSSAYEASAAAREARFGRRKTLTLRPFSALDEPSATRKLWPPEALLSLPSHSLDPYQGCRGLPTLSSYAIGKEGVMVACNPKSFAVALLITVLPMGFAFAGPGGRGGPLLPVGSGVGSVGGNAAGAMEPGLNSIGAGSLGNGTNTPGVPQSSTRGAEFGGGSYGSDKPGIAPLPPPPPGGAPPPGAASSQPSDNKEGTTAASKKPVQFQGLTGDEFSPTGLSRPGADGISTVIVEARPCSLAARETDGTTTCVGIPRKRHQ
jgi:hypothetical protein